MDLYLSPNGRISQATYWRGVITLFVISAVLTALAAYMSPLLSIIGLVFIWPWIAVHVKRFHDADMSGWITIAMVVLAIVVSMIAGAVLPGLFGVDAAALQAEMAQELEDVMAGDDPSAMMGTVMEQTKKISQAQLIPSILSTAVVTGVVGLVMSFFKGTPGDNKFGPPEGVAGGDTFV